MPVEFTARFITKAVPTLENLAEGYGSYEDEGDVWADVRKDILSEHGGEATLRMTMGHCARVAATIREIKNGSRTQGEAYPNTVYEVDPEEPDMLRPFMYTRKLEEYWSELEENDREAYTLAERKGLQAIYKPLNPEDWPPKYWEFEAALCTFAGLFALGDIYRNKAQSMHASAASLPVMELQRVPKSALPNALY